MDKYKWKYRILLIETPSLELENYINIDELYNNNLQEFHKRHVKKITRKSKDFLIKLIGFDGKVKLTEKNKINLKKIIDLIDSMPMSKNANPKNLSLFSDYNPETTVPNLGFKDKEKAEYTIDAIKKKSLKYQVSVVSTMLGRAKNHPNQTKGMRDAIKVFEKWLKDYHKSKEKKGGAEFKFIDYKLIKYYDKLAEYYGISEVARGKKKAKTTDKGFLEVFTKNSDSTKLKNIPVKKDKPEGANWFDTRNNRLKAKIGQMNKMKLKYFHEDGKLKGLPTKMHTILIMWGYSPFEKEIKNLMKKKVLNSI